MSLDVFKTSSPRCPQCTIGSGGAPLNGALYTSKDRCSPKGKQAFTEGMLWDLGFALGLEGALDNGTKSEKALEWATGNLDDGTILGSPKTVGNYLKNLVPALSEIGLAVNVKKRQM